MKIIFPAIEIPIKKMRPSYLDNGNSFMGQDGVFKLQHATGSAKELGHQQA